ncbi:hypothetical protein BSN85_16345 [Bradyrhizobium brasilense]|nr:hypothetical protein BSN85_16345 [Bradyrhizobium brasilense]
MNGLSDAEKQSVALTDFSRSMHDWGGEHVAWLLWSTQERAKLTPLEYRQASMFFLDCGRGPFAVTAGHVFEQFVSDRSSRRVRGVQIGNVGFNPEERLIDWGSDRKIDIATFRITQEEIAEIGKKVVEGTGGAWPPPPNAGEVVFFGGFPGCERVEVAPMEFSFGLHSAMTPLTDFTEYQVGCRFDRQYWVDVRGLGLPPVGYDLGGVSGGPMLQPVYQDGVWGWRLVGVISEAIMADQFERITAVRSHFLSPDGRIGR